MANNIKFKIIMFKTITKRDMKFFFLGIFAMFLLNVIVDWEDSVEAFKEGIHAGQNAF